MINPSEIEEKANEFEVHTSNVQRDYVFGWLLFGLFKVSGLKDRIFLKGGNALRKGYLHKTRFSEDLDFGTPGDIPQEEVLEEFRKVAEFITTQSGVSFLADQFKIKEKFSASDSPGIDLKVYEIRLYFQDFYGHADHIKIRVSIDLTRYDKVLLPIQMVELIHPYSDHEKVKCAIRCSKLEEIVATKLKCLLQRQHPPDLFDYVYSVRTLGGQINRRELVTTFIRKTIFDRNPQIAKDILLGSPFGFFREYWVKSVVCAKQVIIGVEDAIAFFTADLTDLFNIFPSSYFASFDYFGPNLRNPIMEAGRKMRCLRVVYDGYERTVEPYSLKYLQRRDGHEREYFYVYDRTGGRKGPGIKAFVASKLSKVEFTEEVFEPRFPVELAKAGETPENPYLFDPHRPTPPPHRAARSYGIHGPQYVYQCVYCGKQFTRSKQSSSINAHKGKNGYPCSGRSGFYVTTKW